MNLKIENLNNIWAKIYNTFTLQEFSPENEQIKCMDENINKIFHIVENIMYSIKDFLSVRNFGLDNKFEDWEHICKIIDDEKKIDNKLKIINCILRILFIIFKNENFSKQQILYENLVKYIDEELNGEYVFCWEKQNIIFSGSEIEKEERELLIPLLQDYGQSHKFFILARKYHSEQNYDESIINTGKSIETVMKVICEKREYVSSEEVNKLTFSRLFEILNKENFFKREHYVAPEFINKLVELLKTGLPQYRNDSAHGSGIKQKHGNKIISKFNLDMSIAYLNYLISLDKEG